MCNVFSGYATRSGDGTGEIYCIPDKTHSHSIVAGATLSRANLDGATLDGARIGSGDAPTGWRKTENGILVREELKK